MLHVLEAIEGGTARHVRDAVVYAKGVSHVVAIPDERVGGVTDHRARRSMEEAGARVVRVEMRRLPVSPHNAAAAVALRRLVRALRPDVVHGHSSVGGALARLTAGRGPSPVRIYTPNGLGPSAVLRLAERTLAPLTDVLVATSASEAAALEQAGLARSARLVTIPNGIDLSPPGGAAPDLRELLRLAPGTPLIGTIARLVPQKAPERFVEIGARCLQARPDVHLVIIGSGPLQRTVDRRVEELGVGHRCHRIPQLADAGRVLGQFDVFVLPSRFEGAPYTPLEAMRAGTPVVLSDVVGNRDVVEPGVSGILLAESDLDAMARAAVDLLSDAAYRSKITAAAWVRLRRFDVRDMGTALSRLYLDAAQSTRVR